MDGIGKEFMEKTRYRHLGPSYQSLGHKQPPLQMEYDAQRPVARLPKPNDPEMGQALFPELVRNRRSLRRFSDDAVSREELSYLLWCTQGVVKEHGAYTLRTVPSAGARHALETYLLVNRVRDIKPGLYRYLALEHGILEMDCGEGIAERIAAGCLGQAFTVSSAVTFIWAADIMRMYWRYGERGYRYIHLDAGHVCQNLYLAAESIGCGACAVAAFDDDEINRALDLDQEKSFVVYIAAAGKK